MDKIKLTRLFDKVDGILRNLLEIASEQAYKLKNDKIELEHCILAMMSNCENSVHSFLVGQQLDMDSLIDIYQKQVASFSQGNNTPFFCDEIMEIMQDAWLIASIEYEYNVISELHFFLASVPYLIKRKSAVISHISVESLKEQVARTRNQQKDISPHSPAIAKEYLSALNRFTVDLTSMAKKGQIEPVVGRNSEIRKLITILCQKRQNNPFLLGEAGVGKTAVVEGLAVKIVNREVPEFLHDTQVHILDLTLLQAGASMKGEFEQRIKDIMVEVKQSSLPIVIFIDEAHNLIGTGGNSGQSDIANILKPALARGEFRTIAATTFSEYKKYLDKDAALGRRFQKVIVDEPSDKDAIHILRSVAIELQKHHGVFITDKAIEVAVTLTKRYLPEKKLPDKAISILDTSCSHVALLQQTKPLEIEAIEQQINNIIAQLELVTTEKNLYGELVSDGTDLNKQLHKNENVLAAKIQQFEKEKKIVESIKFLQGNNLNNQTENKKQELNKLYEKLIEIQAGSPLIHPEVDEEIVAKVLENLTGIPQGELLADDAERLLNIEEVLSQRIIGQDAAKQALAESLRISRVGLTDARKPIGVYLFCGPSGVGKTETALALADKYYGSEKHVITINMTEFKEAHKISSLIGSPSGYVGYGEGGILTEAVRQKPYSLLLLDEIEKAHPSIHDLFYQIFDKGSVMDSEGRLVDFRNTIIIMTSNAADAKICEVCRKQPDIDFSLLLESILPDLRKIFKSAFLGRVRIVPFYPLLESELKQIIDKTLTNVKVQIYDKYNIDFVCDDRFINYLLQKNTDLMIGARGIEQIINQSLLPQLAHKIISVENINEIKFIKVKMQEDVSDFNVLIEFYNE